MSCELFVLVVPCPLGIALLLFGIVDVRLGIVDVLPGIVDVLPGIVPELCVLVVFPIDGMVPIMFGVPGIAITWWTLCHHRYASRCGAPASSPRMRPSSWVQSRYSRPPVNVQNIRPAALSSVIVPEVNMLIGYMLGCLK